MALVANFRSAASALLQRYQWARQAGMTFGGKRDMWGVLGYPEIAGLTATDFMDRYERGGIAGRVVDVLPDGTWRGEMWLQEDEDPNKNTPFEETWEELERRLMIRSRFHQTDVLSRLSTYAVLLIGTADGDMEKPLPKGSPDKLLYLQPYLGSGGPTNGNGRSNGQAQSFEADVTIAEYDLDTKSARFALPLFYTLRRPNLSVEMFQRPIHWSRVIHVADGALRDDIFGRPALARIWNHLEDLDKVVGGGSEAFWIRANGGLHLNVDKDLTLNADAQAELKKLGEQAEEYQHQLTRMIRTRGVEVNQLGSDVANFQSPADVLITLIAGSVGIPKRLLVGSEQGELASSQDRENFRDLIGGRQANFAGPKIVRALVDRLIEFNYLPKPKEYKVMWPTIEVMSETEKSTGAQGWASVNSSMQKTVFTEDEIRDRWAGLKPLTDEQKAALEEENAKKQEEQQALAVAQNPGLKEEEKKKGKGKGKAKGFPPKGGFPRAAEAATGDTEIVRILEAALETGEDDIVAEIIGLGGAGSGNFGHSGRPGQIGGSGGGSGGGAALSKPVSEYRREIARDLWEISDSRSTGHRRSFLQQRAVRDFDELANSVESTPTIRTIRSAFVDDVKDMADDRSTDHRREFSYRRSSARLEELVQEIEPLKSLGGAGSGNFGHAGRPGQVGGSGGSRGVAQTMQREFEQGAQYRSSDYVEATRESPHGGHEFGVRYYGKWRVPPGEDDDGDYDWEEMTPDTAAKVDKLVQSYQEKNPELKIQWSTGEKNWLYVSVKDKLKTLGGPGSGNFGHAGRPGQIGGSSTSVGGIGQPASVYTPMFADGRDTKEKFSDGKGNYTPERERLHDEIIRKMMKGTTPVEHPTSTILGGGPGVGKSTIQAREGIGAENTVLVNPDEIRNELPEYAADEHGRRPPLTAFTHEEASDISAKLIKRAANENRNIVLDGTGDSTIEKLGGKVAVLRAKGHKVEATYVTTTVAIAQARSDERGKRIGRMVPPSDMQHMHRQVSLIYPEAIKQGLFDKSQLFDSSEGSARLVASSVGKVLTVHNEALWMSFLAKGHAR